MSETSRIHVNLSAVEHNVRVMRGIVGDQCLLCPIVKADGYGLGATKVASHLRAAGADMLAVYTPREAAVLARAAVGGAVLVLQAVRDLDRIDEAYRLLIRGDLHLTVHDEDHLADLMELAERFATIIPVHLEIDTGMSRGGCLPKDAPGLAQRIGESRWLQLAGVSTHFARARNDARFTTRQLTAFDRAFKRCLPFAGDDCIVHAANTCATLRHKRYHKRMVRFGQAWAGFGGEAFLDGPFGRAAAELRPIIRWCSEIVQVKVIEAGAAVGYGSRWTAARESRLGLVPVGYADGYPTGLASTDEVPRPPCVGVEIAGRLQFAPVVGQVNMDQIVIDLTDLQPPDAGRTLDIRPGTPVELIGTDPGAPNHVPTLARAGDTLPHEILCRLSARVPRLYHATERYDRPPVAAPAGAT